MKRLTRLVLLATSLMCTSIVFSQSNCDKKGNPTDVQLLKKRIYEKINEAKRATIQPDTLKKRKEDYETLAQKFNDIFVVMSTNLGLFDKRKSACEEYSEKLKPLADESQVYLKRLAKATKSSSAGAGGLGWIDNILDVLVKLYEKAENRKQDVFYKKLAWAKNWDEVPVGV